MSDDANTKRMVGEYLFGRQHRWKVGSGNETPSPYSHFSVMVFAPLSRLKGRRTSACHVSQFPSPSLKERKKKDIETHEIVKTSSISSGEGDS